MNACWRPDYDVLCVDNFFTGSKENIVHLLDRPFFELMRHDITFPLYVEVDEIYNLACPASPHWYQVDPVQTTKANVHGAINMLGLAKRTKAGILQASTSEVYGTPDIHPQPETYWGHVNPIGLRACYDEGKRCAETLFFDYHRQHRLSIRVARIFNTYGPRMDLNDGRVISSFICQALKNEPLTVQGDGSQTRSFCYVDDLIAGLILFMENPEGFSGPLNLGNPEEVSILELAEKIIDLTGSKSTVVRQPLPQDDPPRRRPDISLAREKLAWTPTVKLVDGLVENHCLFRQRIVPGPGLSGKRSKYMSAKRVRVSVIMPTYNRARIIPRAIRSVLRQTMPDFELIVIDDASTDETPEVVRGFEDPRIVYIRRRTNHLEDYHATGRLDNPRNDGLRRARGEFIAYLDSDDLYRSDFMEVMTAYLDRRTDVDFVYCDAYWHRIWKARMKCPRAICPWISAPRS